MDLGDIDPQRFQFRLVMHKMSAKGGRWQVHCILMQSMTMTSS
jgi:hypothetical protein